MFFCFSYRHLLMIPLTKKKFDANESQLTHVFIFVSPRLFTIIYSASRVVTKFHRGQVGSIISHQGSNTVSQEDFHRLLSPYSRHRLSRELNNFFCNTQQIYIPKGAMCFTTWQYFYFFKQLLVIYFFTLRNK